MLAYADFQSDSTTRVQGDAANLLARRAMAVRPAELGPREMGFARTAWKYFKTRRHRESGLAPVCGNKTYLTPYEMGASLLAMTAAHRIGLKGAARAADMIAHSLESIAKIPLDRDRLPLGAVHAKTLAPIPDARPVSIPALMRLVAGFIVAAHHYPDLAPRISAILNTWNLPLLFGDGGFARQRRDNPPAIRELSLGAEQYAARVACLVGLPAKTALDPAAITTRIPVNGLLLPTDRRLGGAGLPVVTSDPFYLEALEFGWRPAMLEIAATMFLAQRSRFTETGNLTAMGADARDRDPGFAIDALQAGRRSFSCLTPDATEESGLACVSTKAAFGWNAVMPTPYATKLLDAVSDLARPKGWLAGYYEDTGRANKIHSLNTNAEILEALHYRANGPLFPAAT